MKNNENNKKWLKLARCRGVKDETKKMLIELYSDIELALDGLYKIIERQKISEKVQIPTDDEIDKELELLEKNNAKLIHINHDLYPKLLKQTFNAPNVISVKGKESLLKSFHFSVVGSRVPTALSMNFTKEIVPALVKEGFNIVSGLATGIDAVAHKSALIQNKENCGTIAVLGNGLGHIYPKDNRGLYKEIEENNGALLSMFEFDAGPTQSRFPRRNGVIAGMSYGTLVVEARKESGSLITAKYANSFNREVYAVPGFPLDDRYFGTNLIIKQNLAKITTDIKDIMEDLSCIFDNKKNKVKEKSELYLFDFTNDSFNEEMVENDFISDISQNHIDDAKNELRNIIPTTSLGLDQIRVYLPKFSIQTILIALLELELSGEIIRNVVGKFSIER